MKISLLRVREDFDGIFKKSLSKYLEVKYGWAGELSFGKNSGYRFNVNDQLNVIYPSGINRSWLKPIVQEFCFHPNIFRRVLQTLYVNFSIERWIDSVFRSDTLCIKSCPEQIKNAVFIPGNHCIRLIDFDEDLSVVFIKFGFDQAMIATDAMIRQQHSYLKVPQVKDVNFEDGWYTEERISGFPLNRLKNIKVKDSSEKAAFAELHKLYSRTEETADLKGFLTTLRKDLSQLSEQYRCLAIHSRIWSVVSPLFDTLENLGSRDILTVMSHGDFQPANIICNNSDIWIIDWEYASQRSAYYDALVYGLSARSTSGFAARVVSMFNELKCGQLYFSWCGQGLCDSNFYYILIFLIEDFILKMQESTNLRESASCQILEDWLDEVSIVITFLRNR